MMLTGGTGDVKPELQSFNVVESANDTTTTVAVAMPVIPNVLRGNAQRSQVVELLKVFFIGPPLLNSAAGNVQITIGTRNAGTTTLNSWDPSVLAVYSSSSDFTTSGLADRNRVCCVDLTDGNGNGVLVATANLYAQISGSGTAATNTSGVKLLYRLYDATVQEFVGIVASQQ